MLTDLYNFKSTFKVTLHVDSMVCSWHTQVEHSVPIHENYYPQGHLQQDENEQGLSIEIETQVREKYMGWCFNSSNYALAMP